MGISNFKLEPKEAFRESLPADHFDSELGETCLRCIWPWSLDSGVSLCVSLSVCWHSLWMYKYHSTTAPDRVHKAVKFNKADEYLGKSFDGHVKTLNRNLPGCFASASYHRKNQDLTELILFRVFQVSDCLVLLWLAPPTPFPPSLSLSSSFSLLSSSSSSSSLSSSYNHPPPPPLLIMPLWWFEYVWFECLAHTEYSLFE